jgi:hypothetical protein
VSLYEYEVLDYLFHRYGEKVQYWRMINEIAEQFQGNHPHRSVRIEIKNQILMALTSLCRQKKVRRYWFSRRPQLIRISEIEFSKMQDKKRYGQATQHSTVHHCHGQPTRSLCPIGQRNVAAQPAPSLYF